MSCNVQLNVLKLNIQVNLNLKIFNIEEVGNTSVKILRTYSPIQFNMKLGLIFAPHSLVNYYM